MVIRVLAPSRKEKGQAFDLLGRQLLDTLGFVDSFRRLRVTGAGPILEIRGRHRSDGAPFIGLALGYTRPIGGADLKSFYRRFRRERSRNKKLLGLVLSCTPPHRTASRWLRELNQTHRPAFTFYEPEALISPLAEAGYVAPLPQIERALMACSPLPEGVRYLIFFGGQFYWLRMTIGKGRAAAFHLLTADGRPVNRVLAAELRRLEPTLRDKKPIDLALREGVLLAMLRREAATVDEILQATHETRQAVQTVLQHLEKEGLIVAHRGKGPARRETRFGIQKGFAPLLALARQFLGGPHRFTFLAAEASQKGLEGDLTRFLEDRFRLQFRPGITQDLVRVLAISPSALEHVLFGEREYLPREVTAPEPATDTGGVGAPLPRESLERARIAFVNDLLLRAIRDSLEPGFSLTLTARHIRAYLTRVAVKGATVQGPAFALRSLFSHTRPQAPEGSAELPMELGTVMMHMQEYEQAIGYLDRAIRDGRDPSRLKAAWNNKGLCYFYRRRFPEAIECFNEAIKHDPNLKQAWLNKAFSLREVGDTAGALRCVRRAIEIDPRYQEARELLGRLRAIEA
ncbi:MAG: tetratricopeptide repeat protein [Candidatus Methylomirabilales bacterium]